MISIGNDIVDLRHINPERSRSPQFYQKFITETELELYRTFPEGALPFIHYVWLLWSVKESVYKLLQRHRPALVFSPTKFIIDRVDLPADASAAADESALMEDTGFSGIPVCNIMAHFGGDNFYARSVIGSDYLVTVALPGKGFEDIYWGIQLINGDTHEQQSRAVRKLLLMRVSKILGDGRYAVVKNEGGCPLLFCDDKETDLLISLAHHGGVVGYAGIIDKPATLS